jgi:dTDP-4-amino-4,6-dideoxygalactose transaminase
LQKLKKHQQLRKKIWDIYQQELNMSWIENPREAGENEIHSYFTYFIRVLNGKRDELAKFLLANNIYSTLRYHPLHLNNIYNSDQKLEGCEKLNKEGLNIPLHPNLNDRDLNIVIGKIKEYGKKC